MNELTKTEKLAIVYVLSRIMCADGIIHPKEEEFINKVFAELEISISDIESMSDMNEIMAKQILNDMEPSQVDYVKKLFMSMAESDGYVHPDEIKIIVSVFDV